MQSEEEDWVPHPGDSTASEQNVHYRTKENCRVRARALARLRLRRRWIFAGALERGCPTCHRGRRRPRPRCVSRGPGPRGAEFCTIDGEQLAFGDNSFDGAFVNEVMEHVKDEAAVLSELRRVLRPGGCLIVISPNRWFPFEGHGIQIGNWKSDRPTPSVPWLPRRVSQPLMEARNYWPHELERMVRSAGFVIERTGFVWPVFERYDWLPARVGEWYRVRVTRFDDVPILRRLGISTMIVAPGRGEIARTRSRQQLDGGPSRSSGPGRHPGRGRLTHFLGDGGRGLENPAELARRAGVEHDVGEGRHRRSGSARPPILQQRHLAHQVARPRVAIWRPPWVTTAWPSTKIMNSSPRASSCTNTLPAGTCSCVSWRLQTANSDRSPPRRVAALVNRL